MPLGREVDVGLGDIVLDGDPAPAGKEHSTPILDKDPSPPLQRGTAPKFRPLSIIAKRLAISATAEHLSKLDRDLPRSCECCQEVNRAELETINE